MDNEELRRLAHIVAAELPEASLEFPFGPDSDVYMVRKKMFALISVLKGTQIVTLKADPQDVTLLVQGYADILPGYHMNKKHWVTLRPGASLTERLVSELIAESYVAVVEGMPRSRRPLGYRAALR